MPTQRIEILTWVLIYGGLLGASLGWFVTPLRGPWGELLIGAGIVATLAGIALIFVRSKMKP